MRLMKLYQGNEAAGFKQFSKTTIHNGVAYWTGHIALKIEDTYTQTLSALHRYDVFLPTYAQKKKDLLHAMVFLRDIGRYDEFLRAWNDWFAEDGACPPALTCVQADLCPPFDVEICMIVGFAAAGENCVIDRALTADGSFSRYVRHNGFMRCSAITAARSGDICSELEQILSAYGSELDEAGVGRDRTLMANLYLRDMSQLDRISGIWNDWFGDSCPAVLAQGSAPAEGRQIAVSFIAACDDAKPIRRIDQANGRSLCVKYGGVAYLSGITADCSGVADVEGEEVFRKIDAAMEKCGLDKHNVYFNQMLGNNFPDFNDFDVGAFARWSIPEKIYPAAIGFAAEPPAGKAVVVAVTAAYEE